MANEFTPVIPMANSDQALSLISLTDRFSKATVARNKASVAYSAATAAMKAANSEFNEAACLLKDRLNGNLPPEMEEGCW